jgi:recombination protein RecR
MNIIPKNIQNLIEEFSKLPGIGPKSAQRLTFYLLRKPEQSSVNLGNAAIALRKGIGVCSVCCNFSEDETCLICSDNYRDKSIICVVGESLDAVAIEKTRQFKGVYHVLGGVISPVEGIGPDDLYIKELIYRVRRGDITEIILATNPNLEGETTALYIQNQLKSTNVSITRIARGLPVGGDLEYADEITLSRALEGRREY